MTDYRISYTKGDSLRFLSHLELIKTVERALRRSGFRLAHSGGFHPHPKLAFGSALSVGVSSLAEYFDMQLLDDSTVEEVKERLNRTLPMGIIINEVRVCKVAVKPLGAIVNRAEYLITAETDDSLADKACGNLNDLMKKEILNVVRNNKNGEKTFDIRPWLHGLQAEALTAEKIKIKLIAELSNNGNLRPDDLIQLIPEPLVYCNIVRMALWHEKDDGTRIMPLDFCQ